MRTLEDIFKVQSKTSTLIGASDMLEDFAAKGILAGHNKEEIVKAIGEYYSQCKEVAETKYIHGLKIAGKHLDNWLN
jgi:hypothetical protein